MEKSISIKELIGSEVRSRSNAEKIRDAIKKDSDFNLLDFSGVTFVSRSFADELCIILDENANLRLVNETPFVRKMIDTVLVGRKRVRQRGDNNDIITFSDMDDLCKFLNSI